MKKYIFIALAAIAALSSCAKESLVSNDENGKEAQVFTATMEDGITTKVTFDATNKCALWEVGDAISIDGHTYTAEQAGASSTFTGSGATESTHHAYFPANLYNGGTPILPPALDYTEGKFNMPMYAESSTMDLSFRNLCGVLAITVKGEDFTSVSSIEVSSDKQMNGEFTATADGVLTFASKETLTAADKKVTLTFASAKAIASDGSATFYIPVPKGTHYPLTIRVINSEKEETMSTKKSGGVEVERNTVYPITFTPIKTIADVLATVEGGFPLATGNRWTTGFEKYACIYNGTFLLQNLSGSLSLSTSVTKDGNCYTASVSTSGDINGNLTFNMNNGILTNFEFKATDNAKVSFDGIYYAPPLPVKVVMNNETVTDDGKYRLKITIKGSNITSCSYYLAEKTEINNATDLESLTENGTNLNAQQLNDINSSNGYTGYAENCETEEGYKIVLVVWTSDGKKTIVVGGYYKASS